MGGERTGKRQHFFLYIACLMTILFNITACALIQKESKEKNPLDRADLFMSQRYYEAAIKEYEQALNNYPRTHGDQALYRIGIIYASPENKGVDEDKAIKNFKSIIEYYPRSRLWEEARIWILILQEKKAASKKLQIMKAEISRLEKDLQIKKERIAYCEDEIASLETQLEDLKKIDLDIEEKKKLEMP